MGRGDGAFGLKSQSPGQSAGALAAVVAAAGLLAACAAGVGPGPGGPAPNPAVAVAETQESPLDPVGTYDVTMSSEGQVSEGAMVIHGAPERYRGTLEIGVISAVIESVDAGAGQMNVRATMPSGTLVLRLAGDGAFLSGNWVLGAQRGTITAEKRP